MRSDRARRSGSRSRRRCRGGHGPSLRTIAARPRLRSGKRRRRAARDRADVAPRTNLRRAGRRANRRPDGARAHLHRVVRRPAALPSHLMRGRPARSVRALTRRQVPDQVRRGPELARGRSRPVLGRDRRAPGPFGERQVDAPQSARRAGPSRWRAGSGFQARGATALRRPRVARYRRRHVGFISEFYNLIPSLTARENVELACDGAGRPITGRL